MRRILQIGNGYRRTLQDHFTFRICGSFCLIFCCRTCYLLCSAIFRSFDLFRGVFRNRLRSHSYITIRNKSKVLHLHLQMDSDSKSQGQWFGSLLLQIPQVRKNAGVKKIIWSFLIFVRLLLKNKMVGRALED